MDAVQTISLTLGASWAAGINLYAAILALGLMGIYGGIDLPPDLEVLQHPVVLTAAGVMYMLEFFADKIPGVDSIWDSIHTFIRIPAGAIIAAQAVGPVDPVWQLAAGLLGGTLAGASHATKAGSRLWINTSPEPVTNIAASITEDVAVVAGLWAALHHPVLFLCILALFVLFMIWVLPKIWGGLRRLFSGIASGFRRTANP
jgi:hypothetical protein